MHFYIRRHNDAKHHSSTTCYCCNNQQLLSTWLQLNSHFFSTDASHNIIRLGGLLSMEHTQCAEVEEARQWIVKDRLFTQLNRVGVHSKIPQSANSKKISYSSWLWPFPADIVLTFMLLAISSGVPGMANYKHIPFELERCECECKKSNSGSVNYNSFPS